MSIGVNVIAGPVQRMIKNVRSQASFASALALTRTARDTAKRLNAELPKHLDRPTPFTQRAFGSTRANKRRLKAQVFVKDIQAGYLKYAIEGGTRRGSVPVPFRVNARLNRYGNLPGSRGKFAKLAARPHHFAATIKGIDGVWKRVGKGKRFLKLMVAFEPRAVYRKRFPMLKIAEDEFSKRMAPNLVKAWKDAIRTSR